MKFKVKDMDIATGGPLIAILNQKDALKLNLITGDRIIVTYKKRSATCILDVSESRKAVPEGKIGLFEEALAKLKVRHNALAKLKFAEKPQSLMLIKEKLAGKKLSYSALYSIMDDIVNDRLTDIEKTYFVAASSIIGLNAEEIVNLTKAMVATGKKLHFSGLVLDKHSVGGVPGNRATMIVVPIIASAGFIIPKTSSRAITSAAGTADTMECLAKVELNEKEIIKAVKKTGACIAHGGSVHLAPADEKIIEIEHPLSIDPEGQILASVMAKKYSVGASHVLIDLPAGMNTKADNSRKVKRFKKMFKLVGKGLGMDVKVIVTDGSQPIGNGVGPLLEAEDVMMVLKNYPKAPQDLREKSLKLAGLLLEMTGKYAKGQGIIEARKILESGKALKKMQQIIAAQGKAEKVILGAYKFEVKSNSSGKVKSINNFTISKIARSAGAPGSKGSGVYLYKKVGDLVKKGELLFTIYSENKLKLDSAVIDVKKDNGYVVS